MAQGNCPSYNTKISKFVSKQVAGSNIFGKIVDRFTNIAKDAPMVFLKTQVTFPQKKKDETTNRAGPREKRCSLKHIFNNIKVCRKIGYSFHYFFESTKLFKYFISVLFNP